MGAEAIHQFTSFARSGDAVYDSAHELRKIFLKWGKSSNIFVLDPDHPSLDGVEYYKKYRPAPDDILVYHFGIGSKLTDFLISQPGRKFLVYHNMTPEKYLLGVDNRSYLYVRRGRRELDILKSHLTGVLADSRFNAADLEEKHGYEGITVMPILKDFSKWNGIKPKEDRLAKWRSDKRTILFIGRIAANKCQADLIKTLYAYTRLYGRDARLVMPGSYESTKPYRRHLLKLAAKLGLDDLVSIPGFIDEDDFHALFSIADVYLSLSEHEGFGVPFLEAMHFKIPIVAYNVCSIPEVLGPAGIKLNKKDLLVTATALRELFENRELRNRIISSQNGRLSDFSHDKIEPILKKAFEPYL